MEQSAVLVKYWANLKYDEREGRKKKRVLVTYWSYSKFLYSKFENLKGT